MPLSTIWSLFCLILYHNVQAVVQSSTVSEDGRMKTDIVIIIPLLRFLCNLGIFKRELHVQTPFFVSSFSVEWSLISSWRWAFISMVNRVGDQDSWHPPLEPLNQSSGPKWHLKTPLWEDVPDKEQNFLSRSQLDLTGSHSVFVVRTPVLMLTINILDD